MVATRFGTQKQVLGLTLEASRGVAEAAAAVWLGTRGLAKLDYKQGQYQDPAIRGMFSKMPPQPGQLSADGTVPLVLDAQTIGEWLKGLFGPPTTAQQGGTIAYKHSFVRSTSLIQLPSLTLFKDYGVSVKKYNLATPKKMSIKAAVNSMAEVDIDVLAKAEASGAIGSPSYVVPQYALPHQLSCKINTVVSVDMVDVNLSIDNGAKAVWTLNGSQQCEDIYAVEPLSISGGFTFLFQDETERANFLSSTTRKLEFIFTGAQIASPYNYQVAFTLFAASYKAFPLGDEQGFLGAKVDLDGFYSTADGKDVQVDIINTKTSY